MGRPVHSTVVGWRRVVKTLAIASVLAGSTGLPAVPAGVVLATGLVLLVDVVLSG